MTFCDGNCTIIPAPPKNTAENLVGFVALLPPAKQAHARFICLEIGNVPIAMKLSGLEPHLSPDQLETCRLLLEQEYMDFTKFFTEKQKKLVEGLLMEGDFVSVRDMVEETEIPAILEAFHNYVKFHGIQIVEGQSSKEREKGSKDKGGVNAKKIAETPVWNVQDHENLLAKENMDETLSDGSNIVTRSLSMLVGALNKICLELLTTWNADKPE